MLLEVHMIVVRPNCYYCVGVLRQPFCMASKYTSECKNIRINETITFGMNWIVKFSWLSLFLSSKNYIMKWNQTMAFYMDFNCY